MSFYSVIYGGCLRGILLCLALGVMCSGCKGGPATSPDEPAVSAPTDCAITSAPDAPTAIARWVALDADSQVMSAPARAIRTSWTTLHVARAWRVDGAHWMALISDTRDPAPDSSALLLSVTRASDGSWDASEPAQVTRADVLWPQL